MSRARLLRSVAARVAGYREGEVAPIDSEQVEMWLTQFDPAMQVPVLTELDHVLSRTFVRRSDFEAFFAGEVITAADLVRNDPCDFWARARFFNQPLRGHSQAAILELFDAALHRECGLGVSDCGGSGGPLIYVDDAVYTGMHVINDLRQVISDASDHTDLVLIFYALHTQGVRYAQQRLATEFKAAGKSVSFNWFAKLQLENDNAANSDILWPKSVPNHEPTRQYRTSLDRHFQLRTGDSIGKNRFFSSGAARHLLEQEFLKAGAVIRAENDNLTRYARPLGNLVMQSFGFGAVIVTYRNCPNNCPLVFWAGDHPLFYREQQLMARVEDRVYEGESSIVFRKTGERYGGLSNMAAGFPLVVNGIQIRTSEALYQACRFPHLPDVQRLVIDQASPMAAKMRSKPFRKQSRPDWDTVRVKVMRWCLRVKLAQNWERFGALLKGTEGHPIVEEIGEGRFLGSAPACRRQARWAQRARPIAYGTARRTGQLSRGLLTLRCTSASPDVSLVRRPGRAGGGEECG